MISNRIILILLSLINFSFGQVDFFKGINIELKLTKIEYSKTQKDLITEKIFQLEKIELSKRYQELNGYVYSLLDSSQMKTYDNLEELEWKKSYQNTYKYLKLEEPQINNIYQYNKYLVKYLKNGNWEKKNLLVEDSLKKILDTQQIILYKTKQLNDFNYFVELVYKEDSSYKTKLQFQINKLKLVKKFYSKYLLKSSKRFRKKISQEDLITLENMVNIYQSRLQKARIHKVKYCYQNDVLISPNTNSYYITKYENYLYLPDLCVYWYPFENKATLESIDEEEIIISGLEFLNKKYNKLLNKELDSIKKRRIKLANSIEKLNSSSSKYKSTTVTIKPDERIEAIKNITELLLISPKD